MFARASEKGRQEFCELLASLSSGKKLDSLPINTVAKSFSGESKGIEISEAVEKMFLHMRKNRRGASESIWEVAFGKADVPFSSTAGHPFQGWLLSYKGQDFLLLNSEAASDNIEFLSTPKSIDKLLELVEGVNELLEGGIDLAAKRRREFLETDLRKKAGEVNTEKVALKI